MAGKGGELYHYAGRGFKQFPSGFAFAA